MLAIREVNAVTPGLFKDYGGIIKFSGQVSTVKCYENNPLVRQVRVCAHQRCILEQALAGTGSLRRCSAQRASVRGGADCECDVAVLRPCSLVCVRWQALGQPGKGRVLVVDGGASFRCALLGDQLAESAVKNGWSVSRHGRRKGRRAREACTMGCGASRLDMSECARFRYWRPRAGHHRERLHP